MPKRGPENPLQYAFDVLGQIHEPEFAADILGTDLIDHLDRYALWRGRPHGQVAVFNLDTQEGAITDVSQWVALRRLPWLTPERINFSAILASASSLDLGNSALTGALKYFENHLKEGGVFFMQEDSDHGRAFKERKMLLEKAGFVDRAVTRPREMPGYLLWRGRVPYKAERLAIDLVAKWEAAPDEMWWKRKYIPEALNAVSQAYAAQGYKVIDTSAIMDWLHATRNVPETLSCMKNGFGVVVESSCGGCQWQLDTSGAITKIRRCSDRGCDGIPPQSLDLSDDHFFQNLGSQTEKPGQAKLPTFDLRGEAKIAVTCWDCGSQLTEKVELIGSSRKGQYKIRVHRSCPHDGLLTSQIIHVFSRQLIGLP